MRKKILLQNYFKDTFSFMHKKRQTVLYGAFDAIISVDWSCLSYAEGTYLLRASLRIKGRSLVCYQEIHPKEHENNDGVHHQFLYNLKAVLPDNVSPIIVTDALFSAQWFKGIIELKWHFVGRVRTNRGNYFYQGKWRPVKEAYQQATDVPKSLFDCLLTERNKLPCRMVIYKKLPQGRKKKNAKGCVAKGTYENALAKGSRDPWFLATSLTEEGASSLEIVEYYSSRMQIEEEFRDTKSHKYGFGLSDSGTKIHIRIHVLLIINLLASILCWVIACSAVQNKQHLDYHANSSKKFNILSAITLGKRVYKKIKKFSIYHFKLAFNYWIRLINRQIIYGEIL